MCGAVWPGMAGLGWAWPGWAGLGLAGQGMEHQQWRK